MLYENIEVAIRELKIIHQNGKCLAPVGIESIIELLEQHEDEITKEQFNRVSDELDELRDYVDVLEDEMVFHLMKE